MKGAPKIVDSCAILGILILRIERSLRTIDSYVILGILIILKKNEMTTYKCKT